MTEIGGTMSHYKILEKLGAGGMGVVYRAEDTNLGRQVAIKVLPNLFSGDPERLARFEREARLLASLNHPNIATIHGLEQAEGKLTMELVEGETLAQRLLKGPLPIEEALEVCRQIAEGLEAAHEKGGIHRDLKPSNIKVTPEGKVKILDFGLAKAFQEKTAAADLSQSPTLTAAITRAGVILGTAAYMSPEQAKGKSVDKRTDIWAFGCILYECLTGRRVFEGETITETLAAILKSEPDWTALPAATPPGIHRVIRRCLSRDSKLRFHDMADVRIELAEAAAEKTGFMPTGLSASARRGISWRRLALALTAGVLIFLAGTLFYKYWRPIPGEQPYRFEIPLPAGIDSDSRWYPSVAISPGGSQVVYAALGPNGRQLFSEIWEAA